MTDIYSIEKPFGLLDKKTQDDLRKHDAEGGEIKVFEGSSGWTVVYAPAFNSEFTYRAVRHIIEETTDEIVAVYDDKVGLKNVRAKVTRRDCEIVRVFWEADD